MLWQKDVIMDTIKTYIRDRIVSGILDKDLSRELKMEENLTLATATNKVI